MGSTISRAGVEALRGAVITTASGVKLTVSDDFQFNAAQRKRDSMWFKELPEGVSQREAVNALYQHCKINGYLKRPGAIG